MDDSPISSAKIVAAIRDKMKGKGAADAPIQAYIIPSNDAHQVALPHRVENSR